MKDPYSIGLSITNLLFAKPVDKCDELAQHCARLIVHCDKLWLQIEEPTERAKIAAADNLARRVLTSLSDNVKHYAFLASDGDEQPASATLPAPVSETNVADFEAMLVEAENTLPAINQALHEASEGPYRGTMAEAFGQLFDAVGSPKVVGQKRLLIFTDGPGTLDELELRRLLGGNEGAAVIGVGGQSDNPYFSGKFVIAGDFNYGAADEVIRHEFGHLPPLVDPDLEAILRHELPHGLPQSGRIADTILDEHVPLHLRYYGADAEVTASQPGRLIDGIADHAPEHVKVDGKPEVEK